MATVAQTITSECQFHNAREVVGAAGCVDMCVRESCALVAEARRRVSAGSAPLLVRLVRGCGFFVAIVGCSFNQ